MEILRFERWIWFGSPTGNIGKIGLRAFEEREAAGGFALNEVGQSFPDEWANFL